MQLDRFFFFELTGVCCAIYKTSLRNKDLNPTKRPVSDFSSTIERAMVYDKIVGVITRIKDLI